MLINGGLTGIAQNEIVQSCKTYNKKSNPNGFTGDDIREILQDWKVRGLVQLFKVRAGYSKKPSNMWRATQDIRTARL